MIQDIKLYLLENNTGQIPGVKENPRDLTGDGFAKAKQSIKDFPEMLKVRTLVAVKHEDRFVVIGGNQRLRAMRDLDHDTAPVMVVDWPVDKINEFIIKDNVEYGVWNFDLLANEWDVQELMDWGLEVNVDLEDINDITEGLTDENEVPEILPNPKSKIGDVWICGNHRLMCGDSTSIDAVENLMDGKKADLTFTSPPYNANTKAGDGDIFTSKKSKKLYAEGYSDNLASNDYVDFASSVLEICFAVTDGFIFWNVSYNANSRYEYIQQIQNRLSFLIEQICWKKTSTIPFKGSLMRDWEPIYLFSTDKKTLGLDDVVSNHWAISNTNSQAENHKACFPVELPIKGIQLIKPKTKIVFEPFGGSGSTLIACEKTGRHARLMELDPKYCDVIIKRWQDFTGKDAILESTQQKFNEL